MNTEFVQPSETENKEFVPLYVRAGLINCRLNCDPKLDMDDVNRSLAKASEHKSDKSFLFLGENATDFDFELTVELDDAYPEFVVLTDNSYGLRGNVNTPGYINNLPNIVYFISEKYRAEKFGAFTIHAASARNPDNGKSVLILGDKGSGKTSTLMYLAQKFGFEITGNDSVILSSENEKISVLSGTPYLTVRTRVLRDIFGIDTLSDLGVHNHEHKVTLSPTDLNLKVNYQPSEVELIVRVNLNSKNDFAKSTVQNKKTEVLRLYQNTSRYITGGIGPLSIDENGIQGYFPSLASPQIFHSMESLVNSMIRFDNFLYLSISDLSQLDETIGDYFK